MEVRKSDSTFEEYNSDKVKHGICEAYTAVKEVCPDGLIESLIDNLFIYRHKGLLHLSSYFIRGDFVVDK